MRYILPTFFPFSKSNPDFSEPPLYIIQGGGDNLKYRRNSDSLKQILDQFKGDEFEYTILWIAKRFPSWFCRVIFFSLYIDRLYF